MSEAVVTRGSPSPAAPARAARGLPLLAVIAGYLLASTLTLAAVSTYLATHRLERVIDTLHEEEVANELVTVGALLTSYFDARIAQLTDYARAPLLTQGIMQSTEVRAALGDHLDALQLLGARTPLLLVDYAGVPLHATAGTPAIRGEGLEPVMRLLVEGLERTVSVVSADGRHHWQLAVPVAYRGAVEGALVAYIPFDQIGVLEEIARRLSAAEISLVHDGAVVLRAGNASDDAHAARVALPELDVHLRFAVDETSARVAGRRMRNDLVLVSVVTIPAFVLLGVLFARRTLVAPLRAFRRFADTLVSDREPAALDTEQFVREFGYLNAHLNTVARRAHEHRRDLVALNQTLEERIRQRTHELEAANGHLERLSQHDALTGLANRRLLETHLGAEVRNARRSGKPLALLLVDVDHFKAFNDTYGHARGDECLAAVARALAGQTGRAGDLVARSGGVEFVVVLPETDVDGAEVVAECMRLAVAGLEIEHRDSLAAAHVTVSIGGASMLLAEHDTAAALEDIADRNLYRAKRLGRDRVVVRVAEDGSESSRDDPADAACDALASTATGGG